MGWCFPPMASNRIDETRLFHNKAEGKGALGWGRTYVYHPHAPNPNHATHIQTKGPTHQPQSLLAPVQPAPAPVERIPTPRPHQPAAVRRQGGRGAAVAAGFAHRRWRLCCCCLEFVCFVVWVLVYMYVGVESDVGGSGEWEYRARSRSRIAVPSHHHTSHGTRTSHSSKPYGRTITPPLLLSLAAVCAYARTPPLWCLLANSDSKPAVAALIHLLHSGHVMMG